MESGKTLFNVLAVDDNPNNIFTLNELIKKISGIRVFEALSGHEALQIALVEDINLILLDVQMPKMDGFEIAKLLKLKNKTRDIPIVFVTAVFKTEEFFKQGYSLGAVDYLTKPFDDNLLINKIELYKSLFEKQKEIEAYTRRLEEQNKVFNAIFDYSGMGIIVTDNEGMILKHNNAFERILGYDKESVEGKKIFDLTHKDDLEASDDNYQNLKNDVFDSYIMEKRYIKKDGSKVWVKVIVSAVRDVDRRLINTIGMIDDLSEQKKMEEDKQRKEQMLVQQSKMAAMGEMIGAIAHQWRQPLNALGIAIQDILDAYEYNELDKKYLEESVEFSNRQIQYMSKTIDDFRDFFKPNKEKSPFDVFTAIVEVTDLIKAQFKNKNITINFLGICTTDEKCKINGYVNEFKQVILNILNNAKDAICEMQDKDRQFHGVVNINVNRVKQKTIVEISDNGKGIPEKILTRIFEPYFSTKGHKGTGIGLYMSKAIIEDSMSGKLNVKNLEDGSGAIFRIELESI